MQRLKPFFKPSGVAVIGASRNPHKPGFGVVRNLKECRYRGPIYPVNPPVKELEINPLSVFPEGEGVYALDIRGACEQPETPVQAG